MLCVKQLLLLFVDNLKDISSSFVLADQLLWRCCHTSSWSRAAREAGDTRVGEKCACSIDLHVQKSFPAPDSAASSIKKQAIKQGNIKNKEKRQRPGQYGGQQHKSRENSARLCSLWLTPHVSPCCYFFFFYLTTRLVNENQKRRIDFFDNYTFARWKPNLTSL